MFYYKSFEQMEMFIQIFKQTQNSFMFYFCSLLVLFFFLFFSFFFLFWGFLFCFCFGFGFLLVLFFKKTSHEQKTTQSCETKNRKKLIILKISFKLFS